MLPRFERGKGKRGEGGKKRGRERKMIVAEDNGTPLTGMAI